MKHNTRRWSQSILPGAIFGFSATLPMLIYEKGRSMAATAFVSAFLVAVLLWKFSFPSRKTLSVKHGVLLGLFIAFLAPPLMIVPDSIRNTAFFVDKSFLNILGKILKDVMEMAFVFFIVAWFLYPAAGILGGFTAWIQEKRQASG